VKRVRNFKRKAEKIMNTNENLSRQNGLASLAIGQKNYSFDVPLQYWLFIFTVIGLSLVSAIQVFEATGRIWPVISILVLLSYSYLNMRQSRQRAIFYSALRILARDKR
jgi:hypothetical protein